MIIGFCKYDEGGGGRPSYISKPDSRKQSRRKISQTRCTDKLGSILGSVVISNDVIRLW